MKNEKYTVVTGAAGFIGSGVLKYLNDQGLKRIVAVDELGASGKSRNLKNKTFEFVGKAELFDWLPGRQSEIGGIIHLGACSSTVETNKHYLLENNTYYSQRLAEFALTHSIRFVYASSAATYGDGSLGFSDELLEELEPLNLYGYSKQLFDLWLKEQRVLSQVVGLKYFNVFGPNESHKGRMASAVFHMFHQAKDQCVVRLFKSSEPKKYSDGEQKRDFIYVKDAVRMTVAFLDSSAGGIFNIGRGEASTWNELALSLFKALDKKPKIEYIQMPEDLNGKYQNYTAADMQKTKAALGKAAECVSLEECVLDYVRNYLLEEKTW